MDKVFIIEFDNDLSYSVTTWVHPQFFLSKEEATKFLLEKGYKVNSDTKYDYHFTNETIAYEDEIEGLMFGENAEVKELKLYVENKDLLATV